MINFKTPGVYIREVEVLPPITLPISITGFVGQAERGPLNYPQLLTNWGQFRDVFGDFTGYSYLAYAVFGYFLNGGDRCYVVRVAHETATSAYSTLLDQQGQPVAELTAINAGAWSHAVTATIQATSTNNLVLTTLAAIVPKGSKTATLASVVGLAENDLVTLVHPHDPVQETLEVMAIDPTTQQVTFANGLTTLGGFPAGSRLLGRGFRLTCRLENAGQLLREEIFDNLSLDPAHPRYFVYVINGDPEEPDYIKRMQTGLSILVRAQDPNMGTKKIAMRPRDEAVQSLQGGDDGPLDLGSQGYSYYTGYHDGAYFRPPPPPSADDATRRKLQEQFFGLAAFETVSEIGLVAVPDLIMPDLYAAVPTTQRPMEGIIFAQVPAAALQPDNLRLGQRDLLAHCQQMGERFAILDSPKGATTGRGTNKIEEWPNNFQLSPAAVNGALYYPWIREKVSDFAGRSLFIPPCGHIAGIYAAAESARGAGKAPANEVIQGVVSLEFALGDQEQEILNPYGVNCLRAFPGRGIRVWGARTLSADPLWRYVNVRRVALLVIKNILVNLQWTVFEPNDRGLWNRIAATLTIYLRDLFHRGALAGARPDEAFFVKCDETINPPEAIDRGEVVAEVGFAPARPAEFILVTIKRTAESVSVSDVK